MKSPKFQIRRQQLASIISETAIKSVWRNSVREAMKHQLIEDPVEYYDLHINLKNVASIIAKRVHEGGYVPLTPKRILVEKSKGLCRQIVVPHPYDCLVLQCLSNTLHPFLRAKAPHPNAFYQPDRGMGARTGTDYGGRSAWLAFQTKILDFSKRRQFIVVTDITNFYDYVAYSHLRNIISDHLPEDKETLLDLTLHILSAMLWQPDYMPRVEIGLPQINLDAPRLLANACLFELDRLMTQMPSVDYARYMDDIDVGVDTIPQAKVLLRDIDLTLQTRQLRLNSGKTKILSASAAEQHFRVHYNHIVGLLAARIESKPTEIVRHRVTLRRILLRWERSGVFDGEGNGEKVLKRLINLSAKIDLHVPTQIISRIITRRPNLRDDTFRYIRSTSRGWRFIAVLLNFIKDPSNIDDASAILSANCLVELRAVRRVRERKQIADAALTMFRNERSHVWAHAGYWLLSKYGTQQQILRAVENGYPIWQSDYFLGRLVAALEPLIPQKKKDWYINLCRSSRNVGVAEVSEFYAELQSNSKSINAISKFLRATNPSYPNKITHAKWLVLLTALQSLNTPAALRTRLRNTHSMALSDHYYKIRARSVL